LTKQFGAGVFAKFDDVFERVGLPVIRIGDAVLIGVSREEIGEEHDFVHQRFVGTKCSQSTEVGGIHGTIKRIEDNDIITLSVSTGVEIKFDRSAIMPKGQPK